MKVETITVNKVEYKKLEAHIHQVYGFEDPKEMFSIVAMEEWGNDSDHLFHMEKKLLEKWDQHHLDKWKADPLGWHTYILRVILQDMVNNGYLEEGDLLIEVCW